MAADRALPEDDEVAGQEVRALDRDPYRDGAVQVAEVVERAVADRLAAVDIHGVVDRQAHAVGGMRLDDRRDDGRSAALIDRGTGEPPRGVEQIGGGGDVGETLLNALEPADRQMELLADPGIGAGRTRS